MRAAAVAFSSLQQENIPGFLTENAAQLPTKGTPAPVAINVLATQGTDRDRSYG